MSETSDTSLASVDLAPYILPEPSAIDPKLPVEIFVRRSAARTRAMRKTDRQLPQVIDHEPDLPPIGSVLDKYRIERIVGLGGFGVVYRARDVTLDTTVAIKLMRPSLARARPHLPRLLREEARFAAQIEHQNVINVHTVTSVGELTFLVMEYVDGPDLSVMIKRRGGLPAKMVIRVMRHIASALEAGLDVKLIHRDVKPSNILLTRDGLTKLTDFGLARSSHAADLRGRRGVVGTVGYMSPEQLDSPDDVDFRTDIYSLGVTAFQALSGSLPFGDEDAVRCAELHRHHPVPILMASAPERLKEIITWMLAKDREKRPGSYGELLATLDALQQPSAPLWPR